MSSPRMTLTTSSCPLQLHAGLAGPVRPWCCRPLRAAAASHAPLAGSPGTVGLKPGTTILNVNRGSRSRKHLRCQTTASGKGSRHVFSQKSQPHTAFEVHAVSNDPIERGRQYFRRYSQAHEYRKVWCKYINLLKVKSLTTTHARNNNLCFPRFPTRGRHATSQARLSKCPSSPVRSYR